MKRAHHRSLAVQRKALKDYEITPARFDFLFVLYNCKGGCFQMDLVAALGCVKSNVTRLRNALQELGLVTIDWDEALMVILTSRGRALVEEILFGTKNAIEEIVHKCAHAIESTPAALISIFQGVRSALFDRMLFDIYNPNLHERLDETRPPIGPHIIFDEIQLAS